MTGLDEEANRSARRRLVMAARAWWLVVRHEVMTMVLYVSVVLLAGMVALPNHEARRGLAVAGAIWGGALALALAHWFAFGTAGALFSDGRVDRRQARAGAAQVLAALAVAVVVGIPVLAVPDEAAISVAAFVLAGIVGLTGYAIGRRGGAGLAAALIRGLATLAVAAGCVAVKIAIGH